MIAIIWIGFDVRGIINRLWKNDDGATAIEYGLVAALVAVSAMIAFNNLGNSSSEMWNNTSNRFANAVQN